MGIVRNFSLFDFKSKVTERENFDFSLPGGVCATLVKAGKICYAEFEKKSNKESLGKNKKDILAIMKQLDLVPIAKFQFYDLCEIHGSIQQYD